MLPLLWVTHPELSKGDEDERPCCTGNSPSRTLKAREHTGKKLFPLYTATPVGYVQPQHRARCMWNALIQLWFIGTFKKNDCVYIFIFGCSGFALLHGFSLPVASWSILWLRCTGFSERWLLLLWGTGSMAATLQLLRLQGSRAQAQ